MLLRCALGARPQLRRRRLKGRQLRRLRLRLEPRQGRARLRRRLDRGARRRRSLQRRRRLQRRRQGRPWRRPWRLGGRPWRLGGRHQALLPRLEALLVLHRELLVGLLAVGHNLHGLVQAAPVGCRVWRRGSRRRSPAWRRSCRVRRRCCRLSREHGERGLCAPHRQKRPRGGCVARRRHAAAQAGATAAVPEGGGAWQSLGHHSNESHESLSPSISISLIIPFSTVSQMQGKSSAGAAVQ